MNRQILRRSKYKNLKGFLGSVLTLMLILQVFSPGALAINSAFAEQPENPGNGNSAPGEKVDICHWDDDEDKYVAISPNVNGLNGHDGHEHDYILGEDELGEGETFNDAWCANNAPEVPADTGSLTVTKVVVGTSTPASEFDLFVNGMPITSGVASSSIAVGSYTITEEEDNRFEAEFSGDCNADGVVVIEEDEDATCTITNTWLGGTGGVGSTTITFTVNKVVSGGDLDADDFPLFINGVSITSGVATTTLTPGTYTITETNDATSTGYTGSFSGDCNASGQVTLSAGQTKSCTLTNTFHSTSSGTSTAPFMVKIYKYLDGSQANATTSGGYEFPMQSSWDWTDGNGNHSGTGNYYLGLTGHGGSDPYQAFTSAMTGPADYATHEITSNIDPASNVLPIGAQCQEGKFRLQGYKSGTSHAAALASSLSTSSPSFTDINSERHIIVMNETCPDTATTTGTLTVNKVVVGGTKVASDFPLFLNGMGITSGVATTTSTGTSTVSETNNASSTGYVGSFSGACNAQGQVNIGAGQNLTCTLTNTFVGTSTATTTGTIIVNKVVINDNGGTGTTTNFSFILNNGSSTPFEVDGSNSLTVASGTHNIVEATTTGYTVSYDGCSNISVAPGQTKTCTITNNDIAQCPATSGMIVSDANTTVSGGGNAQLLSFIHGAWTADVDGSTTTAKWIWSTNPVATTTATTTVTFNRTFTVNGSTTDATLTLASDNTYRVWINGNLVGSSADGDNFTLATQDEFDVSNFLDDGSNTLTIEVTNLPTPDITDPEGNPAGLMFALSWDAIDCPEQNGQGGDNNNGGGGGSTTNTSNNNNDDDRDVSRITVRGASSRLDDVTPQVLGITTVNPTLIPLGQVLGASSVLPGLPSTGIGPVVTKAVKDSVSLPIMIAGLLALSGLYLLQFRLLKKR